MAHKLLLADDSATIQRVVELTFANEDIDVVAVGDGERAIEVIERAAPDIILADVRMPGKNGYDVASFVRSDPARARIPVVLLTGAFEPLDEARCEAIGRPEVLVKPFDPRHVLGKVRELLDLPAADASAVPEAVLAAEALVAGAPEADAGDTPAANDAGGAEAVVPDGDDADAVETIEAVATYPSGTFEVETSAADAGDSTAGAPSATVDADAQQAVEPVPASAGMTPAEETAGPSAPVAASSGEAVAEGTGADAPPTPEAAAVAAASPPAGAGGSEAPAAAASSPPAGGDGSEVAAVAAVSSPPAGAGGSVLAQSFMTFLAVEQGAAPPALRVADAAAGPADREPALPAAAMDELVGRVVERLTDTVLRDAVAEVVSRIAERLAREEITRVPPDGE